MTATQEIAPWLLPAEAYWSPSWYAVEQERLFGRCWNFVGTLDDFARDTTLVTTVAGVALGVRLDAGVLTGWHATGPVAVGRWCGLVFVHLEPATAPPLADWLGEFPECIGGFRPDRLVEVARHRFELGANWKFFVENHVDMELSRTIIEREDGAACEGLQAAVRSPWFGVGPLARDHELPITRFHDLVLAWTS